MFKKKFILVYSDWEVYQTDDESVAESMLDSQWDIVKAYTKENNKYTLVHDEPME